MENAKGWSETSILKGTCVCTKLICGPGGTQGKFYTGRLRPKVQPLSLLYHIFDRKGTPFVYKHQEPLWLLQIPLSHNTVITTMYPLYMNKSLTQAVFPSFTCSHKMPLLALFIKVFSQTAMTDFPTFSYSSSASKVHTLSYSSSLKNCVLSNGASPHRGHFRGFCPGLNYPDVFSFVVHQ